MEDVPLLMLKSCKAAKKGIDVANNGSQASKSETVILGMEDFNSKDSPAYTWATKKSGTEHDNTICTEDYNDKAKDDDTMSMTTTTALRKALTTAIANHQRRFAYVCEYCCFSGSYPYN